MMKPLVTLLSFIFFLTIVCAGFAQSRYVDSLNTELAKASDPRERFNILEKLGEETFMAGRGDMSVENNLEMMRLASQLKNDTLLGLAYSYTGIFYLYVKGDINTALDYYFKGLPFAERARHMHTVSGINADISTSFYFLNNPTQQLYFAKATQATLPDKKEPVYFFMLTQMYIEYALYYLNIQKPQLALQHAQSAYQANAKAKVPSMESYVQAIMGQAYFKLGDKELAEAYFKKAIASSTAIQMAFLKYFVKDGYVTFLVENHDYNEAETQATDLARLGKSKHNNFISLTAASHLKTIYDHQNKIDSAYLYSKQERAFLDSTFSQEKINKAQEMAFNEELRITEEQNKLAEAEHQRQQNIQLVLIALGIVVFITLFLLISRSVIIGPKAIAFLGVLALLIVFEFFNFLLHPFLEGITHHNPILMLLALVSIAALLIPLHHRLEKWTTHQLVEKNKAIRLALAKRTLQQLETDNLTTFNQST